MTAPTVTISIDRSGMAGSPAALTFSGVRSGTARGIVRYIPPARIKRRGYMPDSDNITGSELTSVADQATILGFDWFPVGAANETAVQAAYAEVAAAIGQFRFTVTTQVGGATAQVWTADAGDIQLGGSDGRTYVDLNHLCPVYAVTIPVQPIPGA